jgi:hypothetical protein
LKKNFDEVIQKYKLNEEPMSDRIADYLTGQLLEDEESDDDDDAAAAGDSSTAAADEKKAKTIAAKTFAKKFDMEPEDATIFLTWTDVCMRFKRDTDSNASKMGMKK